MKKTYCLMFLAGLVLTLSALMLLVISCTRQAHAEREMFTLTACPGSLTGEVEPEAAVSYHYSGSDGVYTISLCDCGKYSASVENPVFDAAEGDAHKPAHYRYFFGEGQGAQARFWFFNLDR